MARSGMVEGPPGVASWPLHHSALLSGPPPHFSYAETGRSFHSPNGQVSSALAFSPGRSSPGSGVTASLSSNHTHPSN